MSAGQHARFSDPITSHEAAASVSAASRAELRLAILEMLAKCGELIDEDLAKLVLGTPSGKRTARAELVDLGLVRGTVKICCTASGRHAMGWRCTFEGLALLDKRDPLAELESRWAARHDPAPTGQGRLW